MRKRKYNDMEKLFLSNVLFTNRLFTFYVGLAVHHPGSLKIILEGTQFIEFPETPLLLYVYLSV
jgi:hypothetical protein